MYLRKKYKMRMWSNFDKYIFGASDKFYERFEICPNIIAFNKHTYEQICFVISVSPKRKGLVEDNGDEIVEVCGFEDEDYKLECAICDDLKDKEFELVYEDESDDDDDETDDVKPDLPIEKEVFVY